MSEGSRGRLKRTGDGKVPAKAHAHFATTRWSVVLAAGRGATEESREALATLCQTYWYPLYAYARRRGQEAADAEDLTQGFFAVLIEKGYLKIADPAKGRFRAFLLTAFKRFMSKVRDRKLAVKRGGRDRTLSLDLSDAERRYALEPAHGWTAERLYERQWALAVLERVLARLKHEFGDTQKARLFERLKIYLTGEAQTPSYRDMADELGMSEGAIKVAVHRLRQRYRRLLRMEIANTLEDSDGVEAEMDVLLSALRGEDG